MHIESWEISAKARTAHMPVSAAVLRRIAAWFGNLAVACVMDEYVTQPPRSAGQAGGVHA